MPGRGRGPESGVPDEGDGVQQVGRDGQAQAGVSEEGLWVRVGAGCQCPGHVARVTVAIPCLSVLARLWDCCGKRRLARLVGAARVREVPVCGHAGDTDLCCTRSGKPGPGTARPASLCPQWVPHPRLAGRGSFQQSPHPQRLRQRQPGPRVAGT